ncbi:M15 family metallopeptidase [Arthrobacter sp. TMN-49]
MPVVGFHQARRAPLSMAARLRRGLSWPHPGGMAVTVVGAALVFGGALALDPGTAPAQSPAAASTSIPSTTPNSTQLPLTPAAGQPSAPVSPGVPASSIPATPSSATKPANAPLITGASTGAPIQKLFATGTAAPMETSLRNIANPSSPLVLVNKSHPLEPVDYVPTELVTPAVRTGSTEPVQLRAEAAAAVERMFAAAAAEGVNISIRSSYRSFDTQVSLYNGYVATKGRAAADSSSARPGFSEHQTGFALDIGDANSGADCDFTICVADTAAGLWVAAHGADYGFVVRYLVGKETTTGYLAEPWHLRYLGIAVAQDMTVRGVQSYEEYLGTPGAPGYH